MVLWQFLLPINWHRPQEESGWPCMTRAFSTMLQVLHKLTPAHLSILPLRFSRTNDFLATYLFYVANTYRYHTIGQDTLLSTLQILNHLILTAV